jgi:hypothetical protein
MKTLSSTNRYLHNREIAPPPTWQSGPVIPAPLALQDSRGFSDASKRLLDTKRNIFASYRLTQSFRRPPQMEFWALASEWKQETIWDSSVTQKILHPCYQRIIGMGPIAVPWILQALRIEPDFWFEALMAITRAQPIPQEHAGDIQAMANDWLKWGRENGYDC